MRKQLEAARVGYPDCPTCKGRGILRSEGITFRACPTCYKRQADETREPKPGDQRSMFG